MRNSSYTRFFHKLGELADTGSTIFLCTLFNFYYDESDLAFTNFNDPSAKDYSRGENVD